uniref:Pentatricopeptide repeat-containing protein n=1 Tax=Rhizophora mucronata TaxID=61149 RepID=A0A2P2KK37_RHIMU
MLMLLRIVLTGIYMFQLQLFILMERQGLSLGHRGFLIDQKVEAWFSGLQLSQHMLHMDMPVQLLAFLMRCCSPGLSQTQSLSLLYCQFVIIVDWWIRLGRSSIQCLRNMPFNHQLSIMLAW